MLVLILVNMCYQNRVNSKIKSKKTSFKVAKYKQYNISSQFKYKISRLYWTSLVASYFKWRLAIINVTQSTQQANLQNQANA